jgi:hypothetical protein
MFRSRPCGIQPEMKEFGPGPAAVGMRLGRHFNLSLEEFPPDMPGCPEIGFVKEHIRGFGRHLQRLGIGKEVFLLDAKLKFIVRREDARRRPRDDSPDVEVLLARIEP